MLWMNSLFGASLLFDFSRLHNTRGNLALLLRKWAHPGRAYFAPGGYPFLDFHRSWAGQKRF